ncbi:hypothetical protein BN890_53500 [Bacteroides xylanisolvens SD CC 1b]|uniref:Uncharacterized protein n=1 Tax=Bacteroides xylanisolvens SD CC 1b TaxID=702447 RepID=W6PIK3_9BACE|nr:hypothetical protein M088_4213 [Bacteroides ovatus str. 3725 D1 iv]KDS15733.1 hypothetical protein M082_4938 [Bacteroides fragilis str. 3725 D9 ii]CAG9883470.1 hypothetical protein BOVA711_381 [Bacteroides ovatus]CDM07722.1 hypothetical protein BN890_53500 [Bacteroides xylanisolvens SD CC 1b]CAG9907775.1 hypothetical protein BOVA172_1657 [Bacteroides ovatus]
MPCVTYRRQACFSCRYEQRRGYMVIRMLPMEKIGWKKK